MTSLGQPREAASNLFRFQGRDDDGAIMEALPKQLAYDAQRRLACLRCQTAHALHMIVKAPQFIVDWRCEDRPRGYHAERAQNDK
jgi:hypothetical protein